MASSTPPELSLPPACAECLETVQFAQPGAILQQIPTKQCRSSDGRIRFDFGTRSLISDPVTEVRILLDHLKQEARLLTAAPQLASLPGMPQAPHGFPGSSAATDIDVVQLGKAMVEGLEAEGIRYVFQTLDPLKPPPITSWEVWTSTKLQLPVLTKTMGPFGQRINICKCTAMQPPASYFQIPPGYKVIPPEPPPPSTPPPAPAMPRLPKR